MAYGRDRWVVSQNPDTTCRYIFVRRPGGLNSFIQGFKPESNVDRICVWVDYSGTQKSLSTFDQESMLAKEILFRLKTPFL